MIIAREKAAELLHLIDQGLSHGLGYPSPGQMCVQAVVSRVFHNSFHDNPSCVGEEVRSLGVQINDMNNDISPKTRAKALRQFAIAELGSNELNQSVFRSRYYDRILAEFPCVKEVSSGRAYNVAHYAFVKHPTAYQRIIDIAVEVLIEMESPGTKLLDLTCEVKK